MLEVLEQANPHHMSAEDVYKKLLNSDDTVGLATYRVLTQFEAAGMVDRHNFDDGQLGLLELSADRHHDHMVDVDSGHVTEFVNERIEALQREIAEDHGYELCTTSWCFTSERSSSSLLVAKPNLSISL